MSNLRRYVAQRSVSLPEIELGNSSEVNVKIDIKIFLFCPILQDFSIFFKNFYSDWGTCQIIAIQFKMTTILEAFRALVLFFISISL